MISEIGGSVMSNGAAPAAPSNPGGDLGKEEFLQLLVAQLRNQDPINPLQAEEFAAQLAQFSQVEQLINLNELGVEQLAASQRLAEAQHRATALGAVGQEVFAAGDGLVIPKHGEVEVNFAVEQPGGPALLRIFSPGGAEVARMEMGFMPGGRHDIRIDDIVADLEPGNYRFEVEVVGGDGSEVEVTTFTRARVEGVRFSSSGPVLVAAGIEIPLGSVIELREIILPQADAGEDADTDDGESDIIHETSDG